MINNFKKMNIDCIFVNTNDLIKNVDKYKNYICLYNLKNKEELITNLEHSNLKFYGYTWDLINYQGEREKKMIYNINHMKASFIVEDSYNYNNIINKCFHIFQPTKVVPYYIAPSVSNDIKFIHFGRLNNTRMDKIIKIAETFPTINIYLYGYTNTIENIKIKNNNIYCNESKFVERLDMYNLTKNNNTFVLSFSEILDECYYSNRIPMLLGYSSLIIQEKFKNIEKYFSDSEMIIYNNMDELKNKINNIINDYEKQIILRNNALRCSKKYNFENYIFNIFDNIYD